MCRQKHAIVCAGCPSGIMSDVANSVSCRCRCQGFHSHSSTRANQIRARLCTIFTSHTLCKSPSPPPPSAHSLQLLWLAVKEDIHPNWCTPTWLLLTHGGTIAVCWRARLCRWHFFGVFSFSRCLWSLYPGTNVAAFPNKWQLNEAPRVLCR